MRVLLVLCLLAGVAHADVESRVAKGYRNGRPLTLRVIEIGWTKVEVATAEAFRDMQREAADKGIDLRIVSGFRTNERQAELYRDWRRGTGNRAARPGYSNHQSGRALDLGVDDESLAWLTDNARRFGFRRTVRDEPWHWEYFGARHRQRTASRLPRGEAVAHKRSVMTTSSTETPSTRN